MRIQSDNHKACLSITVSLSFDQPTPVKKDKPAKKSTPKPKKKAAPKSKPAPKPKADPNAKIKNEASDLASGFDF